MGLVSPDLRYPGVCRTILALLILGNDGACTLKKIGDTGTPTSGEPRAIDP